MTDWIGRTLSKVEIQKLLGHGGMAEVYLGRHTTLNRPVAVKVLHSHLVDDPQVLERFRNEARAVAGLRHPNIVQVFDFDVFQGSPYIVMELLEGKSLADYLQVQLQAGQLLPPATTARLIADLASALDYAHARGIVHRDIKPANIMLRRAGGPINPATPLPADAEAVLTDFGVARIADAGSHTVTGTIAGTPAYMSPEQAQGTPVDGRSDIYSLGIVLYEMLTGRTPFASETETPASVLVKQITAPPPDLACNCPELQAVVDRALAKGREARYQTGAQLAADLHKALGLLTSPSRTQIAQAQAQMTLPKAQAVSPRPAAPIPWLTIVAWAMLLCLLSVAGMSVVGAGILMAPRLLPGRPTTTRPTAAPQSLGNFSFRNGAATMDKVTVSAQLPPLANNQQYKVWLLSSEKETREAVGYLDPDGNLVYVDPAGRNLLGLFDSFEITVQPNPDANPNPSGDIAAHNALSPQSLEHLRHALVAFADAPGQIGLGVGLERDAETLNTTALALQNAQQQGDLAGMRRQAEALVNLIVGKNSPDYGDLDGDGQVVDPGDGYGLLLNGANSGYVEGTLDHAQLAAKAPNASAAANVHVLHVAACVQNLSDWAAQLRDLGKKVAASTTTPAAEPQIAQIVSLSKTFLNGQDLNGNEQIEPIKGEGGAKTALEHAQYMTDLPLLPGKIQAP
jgi:serine/threonine protein kinase